MIEPSPHVKEIIAASADVRSGSISPIQFEAMWCQPREVVGKLAIELRRQNPSFRLMREQAVLLIQQIERLAEVDSELRAQTPNGRRPQAYPCPPFDYSRDIEVSLLSALSCLHSGESPENVTTLLQHARDAYEFISHANDSYQKSLGFAGRRC